MTEWVQHTDRDIEQNSFWQTDCAFLPRYSTNFIKIFFWRRILQPLKAIVKTFSR